MTFFHWVMKDLERRKKIEILDYTAFAKKQVSKITKIHSYGRNIANLRKENTFAVFLKVLEESTLCHAVIFVKYS